MTTETKTTTDPVRLQSLHIRGLFGMFDYDIDFPAGENIRIITGPNGFGKTQILNIIDALFNERMVYFYNSKFEKITFVMSNDLSVEIRKLTTLDIDECYKQGDKLKVLEVCFRRNHEELHLYTFKGCCVQRSVDQFVKYLPVEKVNRVFTEKGTGRNVSIRELVSNYYSIEDINHYNVNFEMSQELYDSLNLPHTYLVREKRLSKKIVNPDEYNSRLSIPIIILDSFVFYKNEIIEKIRTAVEEFFSTSQKLDRTYAARLISGDVALNEFEYEIKAKQLLDKQVRLHKYGLYDDDDPDLRYSKADAKALTLYMNDLEKKVSVFDELLLKLEVFTTSINDKLLYKEVEIGREYGLRFITDSGEKIDWTELSSGEQHQVILLYEIVFGMEGNSIVLIDEPEISLHVSWQQEFLSNLQRIIQLNNFQAIVATHSPTIIDDRWDLVHSLKRKQQEA